MSDLVDDASGAVTVEMVALLAGVVALGFSVSGPIHEGVQLLLDQVSANLNAIDVGDLSDS